MKDFSFTIPQNIEFGAGSMKRLGTILTEMGVRSVLIISGPHLNKMGVVKQAADIAEAAGISVSSFTETEANPSTETVDKATEVYKRSGSEAIIALGGGSPMDVAKAVGVLAKYGGSITEYEGGGKVPGEIVPLIAIPTTAGTGSEVTAFSVITDHSRNYKLTVFSYKLLPSYVILDPDLITSLPAGIAAATGVDAMVHALEAYLSKASSPFSDAMAEKALELLGNNIRKFTANRSDQNAAESMLLGSMFAGLAFNWARLGNVHAMAHPVSGYFNVAHGVANAILLPVVLDYNELADTGRYKTIYHYISGKKDRPYEVGMLSAAVRELVASLGIPLHLSDVGVTADKVSAMAADAMKSGNIAVNPRSSTQNDIEKLYQLAM